MPTSLVIANVDRIYKKNHKNNISNKISVTKISQSIKGTRNYQSETAHYENLKNQYDKIAPSYAQNR